jgi:hypothetical protein
MYVVTFDSLEPLLSHTNRGVGEIYPPAVEWQNGHYLPHPYDTHQEDNP